MHEIVIEKRKRKRDVKGKLESVFFSIILKLPDWMVPKWLSRKTEAYLEKRTLELKRKLVKLNYDNAMLNQAIKDLNLEEGR